ncbi:Wall-associated receptor kinase-like 1 [Bienertia sinuspersici]
MHNVLLVSGCGRATTLVDGDNNTLAGCGSICINDRKPGIDCFGVGCCEAPIISHASFDYFNYNFSSMGQSDANNDISIILSNFAMLVDKDWIKNKSKDYHTNPSICLKAQVVLEWTIKDLRTNDSSYANSICVRHDDGGFVCHCIKDFYEGNPYLPNGCQVVKECEACVQDCVRVTNHSFGCRKKDKYKAITLPVVVGLGVGIGSTLALLVAYWLYHVTRRKRKLKLKAKNFERNGGLLLKQKMLSCEEKSTEKIKIFSSEELDKATDHYNEDRILGRGGQGMVYKGMLNDGKIVAIKKSKILNESLLDIFINEIVLLSQINHRNVVNLLGCCLDSEVPILVYEYVPCGTLSHHIHAPKQEIPMPWEMRLQIGTDIANALAYLHSSYFVPIFHRDIKSSNILLDEKYRAKLSDFGISKSVTVDQTHFTTDHIVGTYGYLDPEYFVSNRFTDKSDVYSFGVVLVELLTGQKAIRSEKDERGLVAWFLRHIGDSKLYETLDARVVKEGKDEEIMGVAQLGKRCLSLDGNRRPTMKEVAAELETIRSSLQHGLIRNQSFIVVELNDSQPSSSIDISLEE